MRDDLISRRAVIVGINNLMESPYANSPQFGRERKDVMETIKAMCVGNIPIAFDLESVIEQLEEKIKYYHEEAKRNALFPQIRHCRELEERSYKNALEILKSAANATNGG